MLCELRVKNLALIEYLELHFDGEGGDGLVVMSGETGAGKSIMLRAIHLLTGRRASSDWVRTGATCLEVEALFELRPEHSGLLDQLDDAGFGRESHIIIKRIINNNGRSKLYINGSLATAKLVTTLTSEMLNVASQHDQQQLLNPNSHLDFIDTLGDLWGERKAYSSLYTSWQERRRELNDLLQREQDKEQRQDFLRFQVDEIRLAEPLEGEDEELVSEKKRLKGLGTLIKVSQASYHLLSVEICEAMDNLRRNMEQLVELDPSLEKLAEDLGSYTYLAEDYAGEIRSYRDSLQDNPYRLEQVSERLDVLTGLKRKYGRSLEDVLAFVEKAEMELADIDSLDQHIDELSETVSRLEQETIDAATTLSAQRRLVAKEVEEGMRRELSSLAFNQSGLEVHWQEDDDKPTLRATGFDRPEFFFSANPGEPARQLAKVASGGELSRLMLAFKCLLAKKDMVDTVIFDEVDSGIGGEAAEAVARKIQELASHHQVFCITHLPQIAARGTMHYQVAKKVADERTVSQVRQLNPEERVEEIMRMLAGDSATEQTRAWARQLLTAGKEDV